MALTTTPVISEASSALLLNVINRNAHGVREALKLPNVDVNVLDSLFSPLYYACFNGDLEIVKILIKHENIKIDQLLGQGQWWTCLQVSIEKEYKNIIKYLIKRGANLKYIKMDNKIEEMIKECKIEMVDKLILKVRTEKYESAIKIISKSKKSYIGNIIDEIGSQQFTAMYCVAYDNKPDAIKWLVSQGSNPSHPIQQGFTPLFVAVSQKKELSIRALLECGADTSQVIQNLTIFQLANRYNVDLITHIKECSNIFNTLIDEFVLNVRKNNFDRSLQILKQRKDVIDSYSSNNFNALYCVVSDQNINALNFLIENNVNINKACVDNITPCALAITQKMEIITEILMENGADLNIKDVDGFDCYSRAQFAQMNLKLIQERIKNRKLMRINDFIVAMRKSDFKKANDLFKKYPYVLNEFDSNNLTALYCCVCDNNLKSIEWLLQNNVNLEIAIQHQITPLHAAISKKNLSIIRLLLKSGANLNQKDDCNFDPYARAKFEGLDLEAILNDLFKNVPPLFNPYQPTIQQQQPISVQSLPVIPQPILLQQSPIQVQQQQPIQQQPIVVQQQPIQQPIIVQQQPIQQPIMVQQQPIQVQPQVQPQSYDMYNNNVQHPMMMQSGLPTNVTQQPIVQPASQIQQPIIVQQQQPIQVQQPIQQQQPVQDVSMRQGSNVVTVDPNSFMSTSNSFNNNNKSNSNNNSFSGNNNMNINNNSFNSNNSSNNSNNNSNNNSFSGNNNNNMSFTNNTNNNNNNNNNNMFNKQSFDSFSSGSGGGDSSFVMTNSMVRSIDHSVSDFPMDEISTYSSKRSTNSSGNGNGNSTLTSFTQKTKTIEELMQEKYMNISLLGRGGFGAVFKCDKIIKKKNAPPQTRAVKLIEFVSTDELNRSLREAFRLCGLQHENVLKVHDAYVLQMGTSASLNDKNTMCIEMEFIPCGDLAEKILKKKICLSNEILKKSLGCMCEALLYLYEEKQMVHRDIKPHNIMIRSINLENNELDIVLGDFGLAKSVGDSASSASFAGTLQYMSPELFMMQQGMSEEQEEEDEDQETLRKHAHASDIFALGVTFYQLMSLDMNTSITGLVMKFMGDEKKLFTTLREKIAKNSSENNIHYDENFINLILSMVKRDPDERLNAEQVLEKLDEI